MYSMFSTVGMLRKVSHVLELMNHSGRALVFRNMLYLFIFAMALLDIAE